MQSRNRITLTCAVMTAIAIAALMIGAAATPAMAADKEYKGFFVALDLASTQPTGLDQHYATLVNQATGFQETAILPNDKDLTGTLKAGYSWGKLGSLSIAYWSFDNEDSLSKSDADNIVFPTVFGGYPYNNNGNYGLIPQYNTYTGSYTPIVYETGSKVKASTIDLDYSRPMVAGEKMTIRWIAGLRSASWEEDQTFTGTESEYFGGPYYAFYNVASYDQSKHIKSDAFGVKVGADIKFGFTQHFSLQAGMAFSFMDGKSEAELNQHAVGNPAGPLPVPPALPPFNNVDRITFSDSNVRGEIRDYDVRAMWDYGRFGFWVGYGGQTWEGLVSDPSGDQVCCFATGTLPSHSSRDSVAFNSYHAGVVFKFGEHK